MSALDELLDDVGELGYLLEIAGLQYRFYDVGPDPGSFRATMPGTSGGLSYVNVPALDTVGAIRSQVDAGGGIAKYDPIPIGLRTEALYADSPGDPALIFSRLGRRSVGLVAYLIESASQTVTTLVVDRDLSGLSYPRLLQIGGESIWATAASGVAPWTLTVVRGVGDTVPQIHEVNTAAADLPEILPEVAAWQTRRAVLYVRRIRPDGSASDWIELMRGFLDDTPTPDGTEVRVNLVPLPGLLDQELTSPRKATKLLHGWHWFDPPVGVSVEHAQVFFGGQGAYVGNVLETAGGPVQARYSQGENWTKVFDPSLPDGHPRKGRLDVEGPHDVEIDAVNVVGVDYWLQLAGGAALPPPGAWPNPGSNSTVAEVHRVNLVDPAGAAQVVAWPDALFDAVNSAAGWTPGVHTGLNGQWMDVRLGEGDGEGPYLDLTYNVSHHHRAARWYAWSRFNATPPAVRQLARVWDSGEELPAAHFAQLLWYGLDLAEPESARHQSTQGYAPVNAWHRMVQVDGRQGLRVPIRGIALAYYQTGEHHVLVEDDVFVSPGSRTSIEVTYHDPIGRNTARAVARITSSTAVLHPTLGTTIGYRLALAPEDRWTLPSFGDWPATIGSEAPPRVTIRPIVRWTAQPAERLLLELLASAGGAGANGVDDVLPFGAEILAQDIQRGTFRGWAAPPGLEEWTQRFEDGQSIRDVLTWPLVISGTALVMRRNALGQVKLTRVSIGVESRAEADQSIVEAQILDAAWGRNDEIFNLHQVELNWDEDEDKPRATVQWHDKRSQRAYRRVAERTYPLRGLRLPDIAAGAGGNADATVRPFLARQRALYGDPRRVIQIKVGLGTGLRVQIGDVYLVSHPHLKGYAAAWGLQGAPVRVLDHKWDGDAGTCTIIGETYGVDATGWNATATVSAVPAEAVVTTSANVDSDPEHPRTGAEQLDCDGFLPGDAVVYRPPGDHDTAVALTIASIDRATRQITFTTPHGITPHGALAAGGTIEPPAYGLATAHLKALAYIASAAGLLGGADPGYDLA